MPRGIFAYTPYPAHGKRVALVYYVSRKGVVIDMNKKSSSPPKKDSLKYFKKEILSSVHGIKRDILNLTLDDKKKYTITEAEKIYSETLNNL